MVVRSRLRKILKRIHPDDLPFHGRKIYNAVSEASPP